MRLPRRASWRWTSPPRLVVSGDRPGGPTGLRRRPEHRRGLGWCLWPPCPWQWRCGPATRCRCEPDYPTTATASSSASMTRSGPTAGPIDAGPDVGGGGPPGVGRPRRTERKPPPPRPGDGAHRPPAYLPCPPTRRVRDVYPHAAPVRGRVPEGQQVRSMHGARAGWNPRRYGPLAHLRHAGRVSQRGEAALPGAGDREGRWSGRGLDRGEGRAQPVGLSFRRGEVVVVDRVA